jgi:hypothetical protein
MEFADRLIYAEERALEDNGIKYVGLMEQEGSSIPVPTFRNAEGSLGCKKVFYHQETETSKPYGVTFSFEFNDGLEVLIIEHILRRV